MSTKSVVKSKELWVGLVAVLNFGLWKLGLPAIEPTPELYTAVVIVLMAVRVLWTKSKLSLFW